MKPMAAAIVCYMHLHGNNVPSSSSSKQINNLDFFITVAMRVVWKKKLLPIN